MRKEPRSLEQMQFRRTAYEVVAVLPDGARERLCFTERRTKRALLSAAQSSADMILPHVQGDPLASYSKATGWQFGDVRVCFSGATERDCANAETREA